MKANAIVRIVIWAIVILVLSGILVAGLGLGTLFSNFTIAESGRFDTIQSQEEMNQVRTDNSAAPTPYASLPADQVHSIAINWAAGNIVMEPGDVEEIQFWEEGSNSKYPLTWSHRNGKLELHFSEENAGHWLGIHIGSELIKNLFIRFPKDWVCSELELDAASATLEVRELTIREVEIDTASGTCDFINCEVNTMDIDTASGDVEFSGKLNSLECDAASASFRGELTNVPSRIDMDSMSGDLKVTLPEDAGFTVKLDAMSSDFSSDFETVSRDGQFVHGDGYCRIDMNAMSGDIYIRKASPTAESTAP